VILIISIESTSVALFSPHYFFVRRTTSATYPISLPLISSKSSTSTFDIEQFIINASASLPPITNTYFPPQSRSPLYAAFRLFIRSLNLASFKTPRYTRWLQPEWSLSSQFSSLKRQYNYITEYHQAVRQSLPLLSNSGPVDFEARLVFYAHYQPEATSNPDGDLYRSSLDVIQKLRSLGFIKPIYYKEHPNINVYWHPLLGPSKVGLYRSHAYLKSLLQLGVCFLSFNDPIPFPPQSMLPVTMTGSIALERSLLGLTTIITGNSWYNQLPGVIHINDISSTSDICCSTHSYSESIAAATKEMVSQLFVEANFVDKPTCSNIQSFVHQLFLACSSF